MVICKMFEGVAYDSAKNFCCIPNILITINAENEKILVFLYISYYKNSNFGDIYMQSLKNKIVLVTGASSGIGAACAECFAKEKANVIIVARREDRLVQLAKKLKRENGVKVLSLKLDVANASAVAQKISSLNNEWQNIDILVNNAGCSLSSDTILEMPIAKLDAVIDTNIKGLLYVTKSVLPLMLKRKVGHIINIGSLVAHYVFSNSNVYSPSKHAVKAITQMLRIDLLGTPIRVSQVDPGATRTEFSEVRWGDKERAKAFYDKMVALEPIDIAETIIFCATRKPHVNIDDIIVNNIDMAGTYSAKKGSGNIFD
jgi:3-hydroxy acid dehydrogenase / malonic semialdehyde reductase